MTSITVPGHYVCLPHSEVISRSGTHDITGALAPDVGATPHMLYK